MVVTLTLMIGVKLLCYFLLLILLLLGGKDV